MYISSLSFQHFRNFQSLDLSFNQGFVVLSGANGVGKTNFLEGLYFGGMLRRFPESKFQQLFRLGENFLRVKIYSRSPEEHSQEVYGEKREGKYYHKWKVNNQTVSRAKYTGQVPVISFVPQDLNLLTRSPGNRRRYLNEVLAATFPKYAFAHQQYGRTLKQRNDLWEKIKNAEAEISEMDIWDDQLAEHGSEICRYRQGFLQYLNGHLAKTIGLLSPELHDINFIYRMSGELTKNQFLEKLRAERQIEQLRATTMVGPHRDDFGTRIGDEDAVGFVSRGQMRSVTLALKFMEKQYLEEQSSRSPILLLDDVFSEFDTLHQEHLVEFLKNFPQVFLTTAHLEEVQEFLPPAAAIFNVKGGHISPAKRHV